MNITVALAFSEIDAVSRLNWLARVNRRILLENPELPGLDHAPTQYRPDPEDVRRELLRILGEARAASQLPWDRRRENLYRTIFPQMTAWLPEEEAAQLRFEFETELARLDAA